MLALQRKNVKDTGGEQNGQGQQAAADNENCRRERNSLVSKVSQEHKRRVGTEGQVLSQDVKAPFSLRYSRTEEGQGLNNIPKDNGQVGLVLVVYENLRKP